MLGCRIVWRVKSKRSFSSCISYVTDVEGNLDYFHKAIRFSSEVDLKNGQLHFYDDKGLFCYGGDVCDHGVGDIRISSMLLNFKMRYPDRVFLVAGNRDLNKMRFLEELDMNNTPVEKVQYILRETMGAPEAFKYRKMELNEIEGDVSDFQVAQSFKNSVEPGGFMFEYLQQAQLAVTIENSLFIHGAIPANGVGFVPGLQSRITCPNEWVYEINRFYNSQLNDSYATGVIEYGRPGGCSGKGIVYNDWLTKNDTMPEPIPENVNSFLVSGGIHRVVTGHRPHGDSPTIIKGEKMLVVTADTSYSDKNADDNRGVAMSEVLVDIQADTTRVRGILRDGTPIDYIAEHDPHVGLPMDNGWIKTPLGDNRYIVCFSKGHGTYSSNLRYETRIIQ